MPDPLSVHHLRGSGAQPFEHKQTEQATEEEGTAAGTTEWRATE